MTSLPTFGLFLWAPRELLTQSRSPEEARASGARWHAWAAALEEDGRLAGGAQLESGGACLSTDALEAGSFGADWELGGYFLVRAADLAEATELARGCPLLEAGGQVEIRPLTPSRA